MPEVSEWAVILLIGLLPLYPVSCTKGCTFPTDLSVSEELGKRPFCTKPLPPARNFKK